MKHLKTYEFFNVKDSDYDENYLINKKRNEELISKVNEIAAEFGEEVEEDGYLGCGSYGCSFKLKTGRVLKLTTDVREVQSAARLRKRAPKKHLVSYYDVRNIKGTDVVWRGVYGLVMDLIIPIKDPALQRNFSNNMDRFYESGNKTDEELIDSLTRYEDQKEFWDKVISQRHSILKDIESSNIDWTEAHAGNIGFDQYGTFKIFDPHVRGHGKAMKLLNKEINL